MDDTEGTAAPQLTDDGAKLLAQVLSTRSNDRHNTLAAQRNKRRREADTLRQAPTDTHIANPPTSGQKVPVGVVADTSSQLAKTLGTELSLIDRRHSLGQHEDPDERGGLYAYVAPEPYDGHERRDTSGRSLRWALLVSLGVLIGLGMSVATIFWIPRATEGTGTAQGDNVTDGSSAEGDLTNESGEVPEVEVAGRQAKQAETSEPIVSPDDIEVSIYDTAPANDGVYSFALRLRSFEFEQELYTDDFTIRVEDEFGVAATTFSRFIHETLPVNSSALATVRAEQAGPGEQFVVVWYGDVLLDRILIENVG